MNYVSFAMSHQLTPQQAIALPALFQKASRELGMTVQELIIAAHVNRKAGEYLASVAVEVMAKAESMPNCDSCRDDVLVDCHDCEQHQHWLEDSKFKKTVRTTVG